MQLALAEHLQSLPPTGFKNSSVYSTAAGPVQWLIDTLQFDPDALSTFRHGVCAIASRASAEAAVALLRAHLRLPRTGWCRRRCTCRTCSSSSTRTRAGNQPS